MCEVSIDNFTHILENIKCSINKSRFITIDTEFSALNISEKISNSLFDSPSERYEKLRMLCNQIIPMQIGISAFTFDAENNSYLADVYTFYVFPKKFHSINSLFVFQSSSLQFLCCHNFDFNKFVYKGIPYINRAQEAEIRRLQRKYLSDVNIDVDDYMLDHLLQDQGTKISKWISDKAGDKLILEGILQKYKHNPDILYFFHKHIRKRFNNHIWTTEENGEIIVKRISHEEFNVLAKKYDLDEIFIDTMLGFTNVFRLLVNLRKPIIGHNLLTDLMIMYHRFENPLPKSYKKFKSEIHNLFPIIYDTKCLTFNLRKVIPENKLWNHNVLEDLYNYFKDGYGRHLVLNSPLIQQKIQSGLDQFHNAGWDSYCTGYIFIRMAHIYATNKFSNKSKFMSSELCASVSHLQNYVNVIRCSVSHINLNGNDPDSQRPPCLIIESVENKPLDLPKISSLMSCYGFIEIKPHSRGGRRAIAAVDNFGSVRRILHQYKSHDEFQVKQYSIIRHSTIARTAIWSGIFASGVVLAWLAHSIFKK